MDPLTATLSGAALGLTGGLAPGPLTALVITQTLRHGTAEGLKVSLAPVLTDGPLLLLSAGLAGSLAGSDTLFGLIGLAGAVFLVMLGLESFRAGPLEITEAPAPIGGVLRAVLTNLLNPSPYLFWVAVGGPLIVQAWSDSGAAVLGFLVAFFLTLCGAKAGIAVLIGRARHLLTGPAYGGMLKGLGAVMWVFAGMFAWDAAGRLL